jgi:hypothetical protein
MVFFLPPILPLKLVGKEGEGAVESGGGHEEGVWVEVI